MSDKFYEKPAPILKVFAWIAAGVVVFNFILITCDVFMRYAFNSPIQGTTEIVTMLMAWVAYLGMAYTLLRGQHMQLGALYDRITGKKKHALSAFVYVVATIMFIIFTKASWDTFWASWLIKEESVAAVTVYVFIGKFGTFLGWLLLAIQSAIMAIYCFAGLKNDNLTPIGVKSELPSEDELGAFTGEEGDE